MCWTRAAIRSVLLACLASPAARGQEVPFFSETHYRYLAGEISGDAAYEHLRFMTQFHRPRGGAPGLMRVAEYIEARAREYGLQDVKLIRQKAENPPWHARSASLWMIEPEIRLLADIMQTPIRLADYSRSADVTAEVVDVGPGLIEADYAGKDVRGKIVLAHGAAGGVMEQAVWRRGAAGVICFPDPAGLGYPLNALDHPDQIRWTTLPATSRESTGRKDAPTFAFVLSSREGQALRARLASAPKPVKVRAQVDAEYGGEAWQVMVEAFLRGSEIGDQDVVLTGHMQEEKYSANDDGSGCASTLEIARALARLVREGKIPRPRRNLRFWWTTEISSERQYFADHPAEIRKLLVNVNQDMVGANQGQDVLRVQNVTRVPFSRSHYLTAVAERVVRFLVEANTAQLAVAQAGGGQAAPKPVHATLGTRHRYNAAMIPFHNSTDHMTFNEAPIGVPGITFTNWPDNYIHTSDDDLWNIDRTQLQRNALAVAMIGLTVASASKGTVPQLAAAAYDAALAHLARDVAVANSLLEPGDYRRAHAQIRQGIAREKRALESVAAADRPGAAHPVVSALVAALDRMQAALLLDQQRLREALGLQDSAPPAPPSEREQEMARRIPRLAAGPAEFLAKRNEIGNVEGLHGLMAFETLNFVDGRRTAWEIYEAVAAEAQHAGAFYYGTVSPEKIDQCLKNVEKAALIRY